ncbi:MAG: hypothetical protein WCG55_00830 [bacterium]
MDSSKMYGQRFVEKITELQQEFPGKRIVVYHDKISPVIAECDGVLVCQLPKEIITNIGSQVILTQDLEKLWLFSNDIVVLYLNSTHVLEGRKVSCREHMQIKICTLLNMQKHAEDKWRDKIAMYESGKPFWI